MDKNNTPLFSGTALILLGLSVTVALLVLFPSDGVLNKSTKKPRQVDSVSVKYLKALVDKNPNDEKLRIQLAKDLVQLGDIEEAKTVLSPLLTSSGEHNDAQLLTIRILFRQYFETKDKVTKQKRKADFIQLASALYPKLQDVNSLELLAKWSYELGEPNLAAKIYQHIVELLEKNPKKKVADNSSLIWQLAGIKNASAVAIEKDAQFYATKELDALLAANQIQNALVRAKIYVDKFNQSETMLNLAMKIAGLAGDSAQARDWGRLSLAKFGSNDIKIQQQIARELAANDARNSLEWTKTFLKDDDQIPESLLNFVVKLARELGDVELSKQLLLKQLQKTPNSPELLAQEVQFELASKDLPEALKYAQRQVNAAPENREAHKQLANVALWNSEYLLYLQELSWLYRKTGDESFFQTAIIKGKAFFLYDIVVELYAYASHNRSLTESELQDFFNVLQATGLADAGETQLKSYLQKWPTHQQAWFFLAVTQELLGSYNDAIKTLQTAKNKFPKSAQLNQKLIELHLKAMDLEGAWQLLTADAKTVAPENTVFWELYSQIAWLLGHEQEAKKAYAYLLKHGKIQESMVSRLLELSSAGDDAKTRLELLQTAWDKYKKPSYLFDAIDVSQKLGDKEQTARLIAIADKEIGLFKNEIRYWLAKAEEANRQKNYTLAKQLLMKALAVNNQSPDAATALLWHFIEHESDNDLRLFLDNMLTFAADKPTLWDSVAAGYRKLGNSHQAALWYARAVQQKPNDSLLLLTYAETLKEIGQYAHAKNIRLFVLGQIRPDLVTNLPSSKPDTEEFKRRYGELILDETGTDTVEKWFGFAQRENEKQPSSTFNEYRIAWMLAKGRMEQAHWYVLKALHKQVKLPAWQQMAMAVSDNNVEEIGKVLRSQTELLQSDIVVGLRAVGKEQNALIVARNRLNDTQQTTELPVLRRQAADLGVRNPNGFALTAKSENFGDLDMASMNATAAVTRGIDTFWLSYDYLSFSSLNKEQLAISSTQASEQNLSLKWRHRALHDEFWLKGSASLRNDSNVYGIAAGLTHRIWEGWNASIDGAYNEISEDSAAFRLLGVRDRATLGFEGEITKRDHFSVQAHGRRYKTRDGMILGTGFGLDFQLGHRLKFEHPAINVNLYGSLNNYSLATQTQLPVQFLSTLGQNATVNTVLANRYNQFGLNVEMYDGEIRPFGFVDRSLHYYVNAGLFVTAPMRGLGMDAEAGIGTRLFGNDDLSLIGRYSSAQGGINLNPTQAIELRYSFRFD